MIPVRARLTSRVHGGHPGATPTGRCDAPPPPPAPPRGCGKGHLRRGAAIRSRMRRTMDRGC